MTNDPSPPPAQRESARAPGDEIRFLDIAAVVLERWKIVVGTALIVAIVVLGVYMLLPKRYLARTVLVIPPERSSSAGASVAAQLPPGVRGLVGMSGGEGNQRQVIETILTSRSAGDSIVRRLSRGHADSARLSDKVGEILLRRTRVTTKDASFIIETEDTDRELAVRVANAFPPVVNAISARLSMEAALHRERSLTQQLERVGADLAQSELDLARFQKESDAPDVREQARRTFEAAAKLQEEIIAREVEVAQLRRTLAPDHPHLRSAIAELNDWRGQLRRLVGSRTGSDDVFLSLGGAPDLQLAATRLAREYQKNEQLFVSLTLSLAQVQADVQNEYPAVSVLDEAVVRSQPIGPGRKAVLVAGGVLGLAGGLVLALGSAFLVAARRDPANTAFFAAWKGVRSEARNLLRWRRK